jgi:hypothetical protein
MQDALIHRRFNTGDRVSVIGPIAETYPGAIGVVRAITCEGHVYRYVVEFEDGRTDTFFGFELRHAEKHSAE